MKKYTEIEDKIIFAAIPEDGTFTDEIALTLKRQLPDRSIKSIEAHWYHKLRKEWLENKIKEAKAKAEAAESKPKGFWYRLFNLIKPE